MGVSELCQEIERRRMDALERRIEPYPRNNPIASDLGDCPREMVLAMTNWQDRPLPSAELKARFERGSLLEDAVIRELMELGITARKERTPFEIKDKQGRIVLRGKVDGFVEQDRKDYPMEVKSLNPNVFQRIDKVEDFDRFSWASKYPRQIQAYLYANNLEEGFFLLDDCLGHWKLLPVKLDWDSIDKIIKQCEEAVDHRDKGTLPDYHKDPATCRRCWAFGRICTPPVEYHGLTLSQDEELQSILDEMAQTAEAHARYGFLKKKRNSKLEGQSNILVGEWLVQGKWIEKKGFTVKDSRYWQVKIIKAGE